MRLFKIFSYRDPKYAKCPSCKSIATLQKSRSRNMREQIIKKITLYKVYRCTQCGWRGYISIITFTKRSIQSLFFYITLILLTLFIVRFVINRFIVG